MTVVNHLSDSKVEALLDEFLTRGKEGYEILGCSVTTLRRVIGSNPSKYSMLTAQLYDGKVFLLNLELIDDRHLAQLTQTITTRENE